MLLTRRLWKILETSKTFNRSYSVGLPQLDDIKVVEHSNGVYNVSLSRPDYRNAFTFKLWQDLTQVFNHLSDFSKCRAIVISGDGKSFCGGIDLKNGLTELISVINDESLDVSRKARNLRKIITVCQGSYTSLEKCNKPVIAAIHGHCIGAGISLASCCDIRYAVSDTNFSIREVDIGIAADVGILQRLHLITGNDSWAREIAFTARDFSGTEALNQGFLSRVFESRKECLDAALSLADEIASKSPIAVQGSKLAMNYARSHSVDDSIEWMLNWNLSQLQTEDIIQNVSARMSKQKAVFNDV